MKVFKPAFGIDFGFPGGIAGIKLVESVYAYKTLIRVKGIADKHRPNSRRPKFRKVTIVKPLMYRIGKDTLVAHPEIINKIRSKFAKENLQ